MNEKKDKFVLPIYIGNDVRSKLRWLSYKRDISMSKIVVEILEKAMVEIIVPEVKEK